MLEIIKVETQLLLVFLLEREISQFSIRFDPEATFFPSLEKNKNMTIKSRLRKPEIGIRVSVKIQTSFSKKQNQEMCETTVKVGRSVHQQEEILPAQQQQQQQQRGTTPSHLHKQLSRND